MYALTVLIDRNRAANLVCDEVRSEVDDEFRLVQGKVLISVSEGLGSRTLAPEYDEHERAAEYPYLNIERFASDRATRDFYFPGPDRYKHKTFMP